MSLNKIKSIESNKSAKRIGRGSASGSGKTSGRGHKGQKSRSGASISRGTAYVPWYWHVLGFALERALINICVLGFFGISSTQSEVGLT